MTSSPMIDRGRGFLKRVFGPSRWWLIAISLLIASSFVLPLWQTRMEAPQYKGDEALLVKVYAGRVVGDLKEIEVLNQYVGVHLPLEGAEIGMLPVVFGGLALLSLIAALLPAAWHRRAAATLLGLFVVVGLGGMSVLQYRLFQMGHERGEEIFAGVDDFTAPVLGHIHVANFDAFMSLGAGGWALALAILLCVGVAMAGGRAGRDAGRVPRQPTVANEKQSKAHRERRTSSSTAALRGSTGHLARAASTAASSGASGAAP